MTAVGIYLLVSLFFVVVGMVEFAVLLFLLRRSESAAYSRRPPINFNGKPNSGTPNESTEDRRSVAINKNSLGVPLENNELDFICYASKIDFTAMIIFPIIFTVFNIIYWIHYLN